MYTCWHILEMHTNCSTNCHSEKPTKKPMFLIDIIHRVVIKRQLQRIREKNTMQKAEVRIKASNTWNWRLNCGNKAETLPQSNEIGGNGWFWTRITLVVGWEMWYKICNLSCSRSVLLSKKCQFSYFFVYSTFFWGLVIICFWLTYGTRQILPSWTIVDLIMDGPSLTRQSLESGIN